MNEPIELLSTISGERLDKFLSMNIPDLTRNAAVNLISSGNCRVNGIIVNSKSFTVKIGDAVTLSLPKVRDYSILSEDIPLDVRYEDADLLVVNKPRGMVVHPANGHYSGTLVNALMFRCKCELSGINGVARPGIVHRLDKDTSGLLLIAKHDKAHNFLARQIKNRSVRKEYRTIVRGGLDIGGEINAPIGRDPADRKKMRTVRNSDKSRLKSREAVTRYEVIKNYGVYTYLSVHLITGRTHQIRVHMAHIGHPVAGDAVYGDGKPKWLDGQCLHARLIGFTRLDGEYIEVESELPDYFTKFLGTL